MRRILVQVYLNIDSVGAGLALTFMIILTTIQILGRLSNMNLPWSIEANRYLLIYLVFFGMCSATRVQGHIGTEFLSKWVGLKWGFYLWVLNQLIFLLFSIVMTYSGVSMVRMHFMSNQLTASLPYNFPVGYTSIIFPIAFMLNAVRLVDLTVQAIVKREAREKRWKLV